MMGSVLPLRVNLKEDMIGGGAVHWCTKCKTHSACPSFLSSFFSFSFFVSFPFGEFLSPESLKTSQELMARIQISVNPP